MPSEQENACFQRQGRQERRQGHSRTVLLFLDAPKRPYEAKPQTAKQKFSHDHPVGRERRALAGVPVTNSVGS